MRRARLFGASSSGPHGIVLLKGLVRHAKNDAKARGFDMVVLNMDADDPVRAALGKPSFYTQFLHKQLRPAPAGGTAALPRFDPQAFHDPRDIS